MIVTLTPSAIAFMRAELDLDEAMDLGTETPALIATRDAAYDTLVAEGFTPGQIAFLKDRAV